MTPRVASSDPARDWRRYLLLAAAVLQIGCGAVFAYDVFTERAAMTRDAWMEFLAVVALAIGAAITLTQVRHILRRNSKIERELVAASGAFQGVVEQHFREWQLTEAERDVALLSIKGVSTAEIAVMRHTREGTIRAQSASIYRKSGVSNRAELISVMIEELIAGLSPTVHERSEENRLKP